MVELVEYAVPNVLPWSCVITLFGIAPEVAFPALICKTSAAIDGGVTTTASNLYNSKGPSVNDASKKYHVHSKLSAVSLATYISPILGKTNNQRACGSLWRAK
jgi:hypothetical protein